MPESDLTLKAIVALHLGVSSTDPLLEQFVAAASGQARTFMRRPALEYTAAYSEKVRAPRGTELLLGRTPIIGAITSITDEDGEVIDADSYSVENADSGIIFREDGWGCPGQLLTVVYTGGWVTPAQAASTGWGGPARSLPADIEAAVIDAVVSRYRGMGVDSRIASETVGDASVTYRNATVTDSGLPPSAEGLLLPHVRPEL